MKNFVPDQKLLKRERISAIPMIICMVVVLLVLFFNVTYKRIYVVGSSMENTLNGAPNANPHVSGGDFVYIFDAEPQRGDIVVLSVNGKTIIKRVIAVGGDTVELVQGKLILNGEEVDEPYVSQEHNFPEQNNYPQTRVENGYIFYLGDNRNVSNDSRTYGCAEVESVFGVVAEWSLTYKNVVTAINTFFEFTIPSWFSAK